MKTPNLEPTVDQVQDYQESLNLYGQDRHGRAYFILGTLIATVRNGSEEHAGCRKRGCGMCRTLRIGLSALYAYDDTKRIDWSEVGR